jgi:hypothetical protein
MAKEKEEVVVESEAKKAFRELIEKYKKQNPAKYELKKDELQKKLDAIN